MTEELTPIQETYDALKQIEAELASQIKKALANSGKKPIRHQCEVCANRSVIEVETFNADEKIKALSATSQALDRMRKSQKDDDVSVGATKILRDRSELSDADLAEYICRLEAELLLED